MTTPKEIEELRQATREAHEALRDLNAATRYARELRKELDSAAKVAVDEQVKPEIVRAVQELSDAVKAACDDATERVYERFDTIKDILTGEDKKSKRLGEPSLEEMAREKVRHDNIR